MQLQLILESFLLFSNGNDMIMRFFSKDNLCYAIVVLTLKYSLLIQFVEPTPLLMTSLHTVGDGGSKMVKVICYKSEGDWFDSRWCHWNFSLT